MYKEERILKNIEYHRSMIRTSQQTKFYIIVDYIFKKLQSKGIILRSTKNGYNIRNKLRLTIGSRAENLKFMKEIKSIFKK